MTTAKGILQAGMQHMTDREETYDAPGGERSMSKTVAMFNTLTGAWLNVEQGWMFMAILKMVRAGQGGFKADTYEDGAAYFALAGEAAGAQTPEQSPVLDKSKPDLSGLGVTASTRYADPQPTAPFKP